MIITFNFQTRATRKENINEGLTALGWPLGMS